MKLDNNIQAFFELVKAGLFPVHGEGVMVHGQDKRQSRAIESLFRDVDWDEVYRLAEEQSVVGLVAAGIEAVQGKWLKVHGSPLVPQAVALQFVDQTLQIEQRNKLMNEFVARLIEKLRQNDIYALLVKGQGIAQCYEKPLWRSCGDVDLYLSKDNYEKAKVFLIPLAQHIETEDKKKLHLGMSIEGWIVELHGTMHTYISRRINKVNDEVHRDIFFNGNVRSWNNNGVQVFFPSANNDAIIVFNHFINHFYGEGVGLRQICDWCRLLWTYKDSLNHGLLEQRIKSARLMSEWKAFAAFAVDYLGMPEEAMPFYEDKLSWHRKAEKICKLVIETGNFGHNKDYSYRSEYSGLIGNFITAWRRFNEFARIAMIFPWNAPKFYMTYLINRFRAVA